MKVRFRDVDIHYEEAGSGMPLICLHGGNIGNGRWSVDQYEPAFAGRDRWHRFYPDMLAHGRTAAPDWLRGHDDVLDAALGFIDAVAPGEPFAIAGVSWGGYFARGVVHHRPQQILGVMLYVPDFNRAVEGQRDLPPFYVIRHEPAFDEALTPGEAWMKDVIPVQTKDTLDDLRRQLFGNAADNTPPAVLDDGNTFSFDPDALAEPCQAPALILTGRQDVITGYAKAWPLLDNFPRGTLAVLDRAGHMLGIEQPVLFKALATEWLDRVEESIDHPA
jgi:pimeloyl-ACP methyl ester carboxylesterase